MKFSSAPNTSLQKCLYPLLQNQCLLFLLPPLFSRISQASGPDQENSKRAYCVDYHPKRLGLTSRIHPLIFLRTPEGFICPSRIFVEFYLKPIYPTMVGESLQIHGVQITGKCICQSSLQSKTLFQVLIITPPPPPPPPPKITNFSQAEFFENWIFLLDAGRIELKK